MIGTHGLLTGAQAKELGAFYTADEVARFLVEWAVRKPTDRVIDPSFGEGVFLECACQRISELGGDPRDQISGVELEPTIHDLVANHLSNSFGVLRQNLLASDFFELGRQTLGPIDVVVGNPPFIRYQRFSGELRHRALTRALEHGVRLTRLSSSWAPFLVHSASLLRPGGRLAMVAPAELAHAQYARPVLEFFSDHFGSVTFLTFRRKVFPELSEDTMLVLADDKGAPSSRFFHCDLQDSKRLKGLLKHRYSVRGARAVNGEGLCKGQQKLVEYLVSKKAGELYRELTNSPKIKRLGRVADIGIGYVTGANDFFHLNRETARTWKIPSRFLLPAVRRSRGLCGLRFTKKDLEQGFSKGDAAYLLALDGARHYPDAVTRYLNEGERRGIPQAFKCRTRFPWYKVPHVHRCDGFLSYMSGREPRLVANKAGAVAPNTLHIVRMHSPDKLTSLALAALWRTSITRLSTEIEGHSLGGGLLKLEPTEAENVLVALPQSPNGSFQDVGRELDVLLRRGKTKEAQVLADDLILRGSLGFSVSDCRILRQGAAELQRRRCSRSKKA